MPDDFHDFLTQYERLFPERWNNTRIKVMVLGPNTDKTTPGAILREFIIQKCKEYGVGIKGERKELIETYRRTVGPSGDLCRMELDLAINEVNALIMIPDSAGSLVELGMFVFFDDVCRRTLVLFSDEYWQEQKTETSFIELGPKSRYEAKHAKTPVVKYTEKDLVWQIVDEFLQWARGERYDELLKEL